MAFEPTRGRKSTPQQSTFEPTRGRRAGQPAAPQKKKGIFSRIAERTKGIIGRRSERLGEIADVTGRGQTLAESALQTAGTAIGGLGEIAFGAVAEATPEFVKKPLVGALEAAAPVIEPIAKQLEQFEKENPRLARNITAGLEVAEVLPLGGGIKASKKAVESVGKTTYKGISMLDERASQMIKTIKDARTTPSEEAGNIMQEIIRPTAGEVKKMEIKRGKNISEIGSFMAKEKMIPDVTPDKKMDWKEAIAEQRERLSIDGDARNKVLASADESLETGDLDVVRQSANIRMDEIFKNASEAKEAKSIIDDLIENEIDKFGGELKPSQISEVVQGMWSVGFRADKPLKSRVARIVGHELNDFLDDFVPDPRLKEINRRMGNRLDSISLMENATGRVIQAGRLGNYFAMMMGVGAGAVIPGVGPIVGGIAGKKMAEILAKRAPKAAAKKAAKKVRK